MRNYLIVSIFVLAFAVCSSAQDKIKLANGDILRGAIVSYQRDSLLVLRDDDGVLITVSAAELQGIEIAQQTDIAPSSVPRYFGFGQSSLSASYSNTYWGGYSLLLGGELGGGIGININPYLSAMFGTGISVVDLGVQPYMTSVPVWLEGRVDLGEGRVQPFFGARAGYSFSLDKQTAAEQVLVTGGMMLAPNIGFKFNLSGRLGVSFDAGIYLQKAKVIYTYYDWEGEPNTTTDDLLLRRVQLRACLFF